MNGIEISVEKADESDFKTLMMTQVDKGIKESNLKELLQIFSRTEVVDFINEASDMNKGFSSVLWPSGFEIQQGERSKIIILKN